MDWYVIFTKPRQEERALENLERQGFECYLPTLEIERIRHGKKCTVVEPMFTRYLFIQLDDSIYARSWIPIRSTRGVNQIVTFGGRPAKVRPELISILRSRSGVGGTDVKRMFSPGEVVRVVGDIWAGLDAIYEMDDGMRRAMVFIELLGRPIRMELPVDQLMKV